MACSPTEIFALRWLSLICFAVIEMTSFTCSDALQFDDLNDDESDAEFDDYAYTESQLVA